MNTYKKTKRGFSFIEIVLITMSCVTMLAAGVLHAVVKNSQIEVGREKGRTERLIQERKDEVSSLQVKIDKKLNIFQLRNDLNQAGSELVIIPSSSIEYIPAHENPQTIAVVASTVTSPIKRTP